MAAWGVEGRVPFSTRSSWTWRCASIPPTRCGKGKIEKHILREAFEDLLPHEVAWRQKEQFSDGVGYSWIDSLKAMVEEEVTDQMFEAAAFRFPRQHPAHQGGVLLSRHLRRALPAGESAARTVPYGSRSPAPPRPRSNGMPSSRRWPDPPVAP